MKWNLVNIKEQTMLVLINCHLTKLAILVISQSTAFNFDLKRNNNYKYNAFVIGCISIPACKNEVSKKVANWSIMMGSADFSKKNRKHKRKAILPMKITTCFLGHLEKLTYCKFLKAWLEFCTQSSIHCCQSLVTFCFIWDFKIHA